MLSEHLSDGRLRGARGQLRAAALHLGGLLGWQAHEVAAFAEALTGCPWDECDRGEFARVLDEYQELALAIAARKRRRGARRHWEGADADDD